MKDRRDGKRVTRMSGMHGLISHFKPSRADSDVYINQKVDVTELVKYYEDLKKDNNKMDITYFHLFCSAIGKIIYNRPLLNRFFINKKLYTRNDISISFVAKKEFTDTAEESLTVIKIDNKDNIYSLADKIKGNVKEIREMKNNKTDNFIDVVGNLPKFIKSFLMALVRFADNHDLIPESLTENSIYHSTVLVSNLGSINCGAIYHNLTDFGTNSIIITIGEIKDEYVIINGKPEIRKMCEIGANLDERIADGFYFVKSLQLFDYLMANPHLLEESIDTKLDSK